MRFANKHGACEIDTVPGCSQLAISHYVFIRPENRGQGEGQKNHDLRLKRMKDLLYDCVICTVDYSNLAQKHILEKFGWKNCHSFFNQKTGHTVEIWARNL